MTTETVPATERADEQGERTQKIADLRQLADWLEERPWLPIPGIHVNDHVYGLDGYQLVTGLAERGGKLDTHLNDRTVVAFDEGPLIYRVIAWHEGGRPGEKDAELAKLRARVAELEASTDRPDPLGLTYSREADEPDDPRPVSPAARGLHVGAVTDGGLVPVDEADLGDPGRCRTCGDPLAWAGPVPNTVLEREGNRRVHAWRGRVGMPDHPYDHEAVIPVGEPR